MKFTKKSLNAILVSAALLTAGIAPTQAIADNMTVKAVDGMIIDKHLNSINF